jgi:chorismate dehydratase
MSVIRIGVVPYLNACVLIDGLDGRAGIEIHRIRPSGLASMLKEGQIDVALLPAADFHDHSVAWQMVCPYGIVCDGPAWTVRIFSDVPLEEISQLHVDADSHSSVALAKVIFLEWQRRSVAFIPGEFKDRISTSDQAWLLIGDKAMAGPAKPYVYDLGELWRDRTSLSFVFAMWVAPQSAAIDGLSELLTEVAERNLCRIDDLAKQYGPKHGFDVPTAREYLGNILRYRIGSRELDGLELFGRLHKKRQRRERISV